MAAWLLFAALVAGLAGAAAHLAEGMLRRGGWPVRWAWVAALASGALLPLLLPRWGSTAPPTRGNGAASAGETVWGVPGAAAAAGLPGGALDLTLALAWVVLSLLALGRLAGSLLELRRDSSRWRPASLLGSPVRLSGRSGPAVAGVLRPSIVVPDWVLDLAPADQALLLAHEREHLRARDPLLLLAAALLQAILPLNPALRWQVARLRAAVEMDCDARVLAGTDSPARRYGLLLLEVGRRARLAPAGVGFAAPSALERRLRALGRGAAVRRGRALAVAAAMGVTAAVAAASIPRPAPPELRRLAAEAGGILAPAPPADLGAGPGSPPELLNRHETPQILRHAYPERLRSSGVGGTVLVEALVDRSGRVREATVVDGSGNAELDEAALRAFAELRYRPARMAGRPVEAWTRQPVTFLPGAPEPLPPPAPEPAPLRIAIWTGGL